MKYCSQCGQRNKDDARFCAKYGARMTGGGKRQASSWIDQLNEYVGNDKPADLNWKSLFSDVFKEHSVDEAEEKFICGTRTTTPSPSEVKKKVALSVVLQPCVSAFFAGFFFALGLL